MTTPQDFNYWANRVVEELSKAKGDEPEPTGTQGKPTEGTKTFGTADPSKIKMDERFQPRYKGAKNKDGSPKMFDQETVDKWAQSGKQEGYESGWNPIAADPVELYRDPKDGNLYVLAGYHRTALARQTGQKSVDAIVYDGITEKEAIDIAKRSNTKTKPQAPMDDAIMFRSAADEGMSIPQINMKFDQRGEGLIRKRILLTHLSPGMQAEVRNAPDTMIPYFEHIGLAAKVGASPSVQAQLYKHALNADSSAAQFRQMCVTVANKIKEGGGKYKTASLGDMFGGADEGMKAFTEAVEQGKRDKKTLDALTSAHNGVERLVAMMHESGKDVPEVYTAMLAQAKKDRDAFLKERAERKGGESDAGEDDDEEQAGGKKFEFGHHVHAHGKSGVYLKDMGDGDHYVYTGHGRKGVEMVHESKIEHAHEDHKPAKHVVEGAHAHPSAKHVIEIGPRGGKRTAWYMGKDGKKKYEYEEHGGQPMAKSVLVIQPRLEKSATGRKPSTGPQSIVFHKQAGFEDKDAVKAWLKAHDFHADSIDETDESYRARQFDPGDGDYRSKVVQKKDGDAAITFVMMFADEDESMDKSQGDILPGGKGDDVDASKFPVAAVIDGLKHEMEHTDDPKIALEIALDHLSEDVGYYTKLAKMEAGA